VWQRYASERQPQAVALTLNVSINVCRAVSVRRVGLYSEIVEVEVEVEVGVERSVSFSFHGSEQVPTRRPILIFRKVPQLEACAALEQIDSGNAQDIPEIFHCLAVAIRAVCPRIRHSENTSKTNTEVQSTRHEIPCIDTQLSPQVCFDPDAVLAAVANQKSHISYLQANTTRRAVFASC